MYKKVKINEYNEINNYPKGSYCFDYKSDLRYYVDGKPHRLFGPAIEYANGHKEWHYKGTLHRTDGPAIEWNDGDQWWYLHGNRYYSYEEWKSIVDNYLVYLWNKLTLTN